MSPSPAGLDHFSRRFLKLESNTLIYFESIRSLVDELGGAGRSLYTGASGLPGNQTEESFNVRVDPSQSVRLSLFKLSPGRKYLS